MPTGVRCPAEASSQSPSAAPSSPQPQQRAVPCVTGQPKSTKLNVGNNLSALFWERAVISQGGENKKARYSPSSLWMLHEAWCNLCTASEFSSVVGLGINWYQELGGNTAKSRRLKIHSSCLLSWILVWEKACMDNLLFPR